MKTSSEAPIISRQAFISASDVYKHYQKAHRRVVVSLETQFIPPSYALGSAFGAIDLDGVKFTFVPMDYSLSTPENHLSAAIALLREQYEGEYVLISCDSNSSDSGYTWTFEAK